MTALAYTVRITCPSPDTAAQMRAWLAEGHIAAVIAGGAESADLVEMEGEDRVIEVRYRFPDADVFARYERDFAPALREDGRVRFPPESGFAYERTVGAVESF